MDYSPLFSTDNMDNDKRKLKDSYSILRFMPWTYSQSTGTLTIHQSMWQERVIQDTETV